MRRLAWILPAAVIAVAGAALLWLTRPTWGICIDVVEGAPGGGCFSGTTDGPAILFSALLAVELVAVILLALLLRVPRRPEILGILLAVMGITALVGFGVAVSGVWVPPYPIPGM